MTEPLIAGLDLETTGLLTPDHRITEVYLGLWRANKKVWEFEARVNPQRSVSAEASRVTGIHTSDLIGKPTWAKVAPVISKALAKADFVVAHNGAEFDWPFLKQEHARVDVALPERPVFDTMKQGVWATPIGKWPNMAQLCFACGVGYDPAKAHAASYDVDRMMECFFNGADWGFFVPPVPERMEAA